MANKPCFGQYRCPHFGNLTVVFWDGNRREYCNNCREGFKIKRQQMINVMPYKGTPPREGEKTK